MEAKELLKTEVVNIGKRIRKYYTLTAEGRSIAKGRVHEFMDFIKSMSFVFQVKKMT